MADTKPNTPPAGAAPENPPTTVPKEGTPNDAPAKPAKSTTVGAWPKTLPGHPPAAPGR